VTPLGLLIIIGLLVALRLVVGLRPVASMVDGTQRVISGVPSTDAPSNVIREYLDAFIMAGIAALFLITFVVRTFFIPSGSMIPTLLVHDVLLVSEFEYRFGTPRDGEVAVFKPPIPATSDFIKRVIGEPGDKIRIQDGIVYRNGKALDEQYILQRPAYDLDVRNYGIYVDGVRLDAEAANIPARSQWSSPDRIPSNCYLMFGDNRNDSEDSHIWGFAQAHGSFMAGPLRGQPAQFTGHAIFVFWPLDRIHFLH
jgi:signal peptidase I